MTFLYSYLGKYLHSWQNLIEDISLILRIINFVRKGGKNVVNTCLIDLKYGVNIIGKGKAIPLQA